MVPVRVRACVLSDGTHELGRKWILTDDCTSLIFLTRARTLFSVWRAPVFAGDSAGQGERRNYGSALEAGGQGDHQGSLSFHVLCFRGLVGWLPVASGVLYFARRLTGEPPPYLLPLPFFFFRVLILIPRLPPHGTHW